MNLKDLLADITDKAAWKAVPREAIKLANKCKDTYNYIKKAYHLLPKDNKYCQIWYDPEDKVVFFNTGKINTEEKLAAFTEILSEAPNVEALIYDTVRSPLSNSFIKFNYYNIGSLFGEKRANEVVHELTEANPVPEVQSEGTQPFKGLAQVGGWREGLPASLVGGSNALSGMLATGLLGAGAGYGLGALMENLFPERYIKKGPIRNLTGLMGGAIGAVPGLWTGLARYSNQAPENSSLVNAFLQKSAECIAEDCEISIEPSEMHKLALDNILEDPRQDFNKFINVPDMNNMVWSPRDRFTPTNIRSGASGLFTAASENDSSDFISPMSITKIVLGSGGGLVGGTVVGKVLGALAGLKKPYQEKLQDMGLWAGLLSTAIPLAFGK